MSDAFDRIRDGLEDALAWSKGETTAALYIDGKRYEMTRAEYEVFKVGRAAGRLAGLREAAEVARGCQTFDWKGGEEWAAGYVDGKNAAAGAILALAEGQEG